LPALGENTEPEPLVVFFLKDGEADKASKLNLCSDAQRLLF
jgi:hypothetical protein